MYRESELPPPRTLHDPQAVGIATFLGSPVAGAMLMALNERAVGRPREAWKVLGLGLAASAAIVALSMLLPSSIPSGAFGGVNVAIAMGARQLATEWFRKGTESGLLGEVRYRTRWAAAGVGLIAVLLVVGAMLGIGAATEHTTPHVELRPGANVYYEGVTEGDARRIGDLLRGEGFFQGTQETDVRYERVAGGHALSFIVEESRIDDATLGEFEALAGRLQPATDPSATLTVRLCKPDWTAVRELHAPRR